MGGSSSSTILGTIFPIHSASTKGSIFAVERLEHGNDLFMFNTNARIAFVQYMKELSWVESLIGCQDQHTPIFTLPSGVKFEANDMRRNKLEMKGLNCAITLPEEAFRAASPSPADSFLTIEALRPLIVASLFPLFLESKRFRRWLDAANDGLVYDPKAVLRDNGTPMATDAPSAHSNSSVSGHSSLFDSARRSAAAHTPVSAHLLCVSGRSPRLMTRAQACRSADTDTDAAASVAVAVAVTAVLGESKDADPQLLSVGPPLQLHMPVSLPTVEEGPSEGPTPLPGSSHPTPGPLPTGQTQAQAMEAPVGSAAAGLRGSLTVDTIGARGRAGLATSSDPIDGVGRNGQPSGGGPCPVPWLAAQSTAMTAATKPWHRLSLRDQLQSYLIDVMEQTDVSVWEALLANGDWREKALALLDDSPVSLSLSRGKGPHYQLVFANKHFSQVTQFPHKEALGKTCSSLMQEVGFTEDVQIAKLAHALRYEQPVKVVLSNVRKDQSSFVNCLTLQPVFDEQDLCKYIIGIQWDYNASTNVHKDLLLMEVLLTLLPSLLS